MKDCTDENYAEIKLDPKKVASEILDKVFDIKLENCILWEHGIATFLNIRDLDSWTKKFQDLLELKDLKLNSSDVTVSFEIILNDCNKEVAKVFEKRFNKFLFSWRRLPNIKTSKRRSRLHLDLLVWIWNIYSCVNR